jgi:hypothetical protein
MKTIKTTLLITALAFGILPLMAQSPKRAASTGGNSPHETTSAMIDGNRVTLVYGRPSVKDPRSGETRKIWGGLVPYGKVWRTGSDEATLLITQKPITLGETSVPAGAYSLYTLPNEDGSAKLIINKQIGQWGTQYDEKQDLARVDLKKEAVENTVEQFTMSVSKNASGGGLLKLSWEKMQYSVPFTVSK